MCPNDGMSAPTICPNGQYTTTSQNTACTDCARGKNLFCKYKSCMYNIYFSKLETYQGVHLS